MQQTRSTHVQPDAWHRATWINEACGLAEVIAEHAVRRELLFRSLVERVEHVDRQFEPS